MRPKSKGNWIGDEFWPDGMKLEDHKKPMNKSATGYVDKEGRMFWVCYTDVQVQNQVDSWGFFFPFAPLFITDLKGVNGKAIDYAVRPTND